VKIGTWQRGVGLLGTRFTMEEPFYADRMHKRFGIETIVRKMRPADGAQHYL
jgi:aspartate/glutamate racemase